MVYIYHIFFIHSSADGHLGCFHVLAVVNSAAVCSGIHVSFWIMMFSGLFSGVGLLLARRLCTSRSSGMKIEQQVRTGPCCWRCEGLNLILMAGLDPGWCPSKTGCMCLCACSVMSDSLQPHGPYSPSGSSIHGISQARILGWAAISFSRGSSCIRDWIHVSCLSGVYFTIEPPGMPADSSWMICVGSLTRALVFSSASLLLPYPSLLWKARPWEALGWGEIRRKVGRNSSIFYSKQPWQYYVPSATGDQDWKAWIP